MGSCPFWFPAILANKYCCCCCCRKSQSVRRHITASDCHGKHFICFYGGGQTWDKAI